MHEFPYLQWQQEVHVAKLRAAYPHAADKIIIGGPVGSGKTFTARALPALPSRKAFRPPRPVTRSTILITFHAHLDPSMGVLRHRRQAKRATSCSHYFRKDATSRSPEKTYCESRNETLDDHWARDARLARRRAKTAPVLAIR